MGLVEDAVHQPAAVGRGDDRDDLAIGRELPLGGDLVHDAGDR